MASVEHPGRWQPLTAMPAGAREWLAPDYEALANEWGELKTRLQDDDRAAAFVAERLRKRQRDFAIETGAIERLYHLRRGVTQHLIAEGLQTAVAAHTHEGVPTETLRGLLKDQEAALEVVYRDTSADAEISPTMLRRWHALLVRHQGTVTGVTSAGTLGEIPFAEKGVWKTQPNNPAIPGRGVFEYCPPARVPEEMDRLCSLYRRIRMERFPAHAEAAWLHHRFVRTHPFQDGNGRVSRLLMASCYSRRGLARLSHQAACRRQKAHGFHEVDRDVDDRANCGLRLPAPSRVFWPCVHTGLCSRTCSLNRSASRRVRRAYAFGREHAHRAKILRDHHGPW